MALALCDTKTDQKGMELARHGTALFPIACYHDDLTTDTVPWHWHTELEAVVVTEGTAVLAVDSKRFPVRQGDGFFVNSSVLHAVQNGAQAKCRLHSAVFHPRLVGGSYDSIFWHHYIRPLTEDGAQKYIPFDRSKSWHEEVLRSIETAWKYCAQEPPGYEFRVRNALSDLVFLLSGCRTAAASPVPEKVLREENRIKQMLLFIHEHYASQLSTAAIARSAAISESECLRCFHHMIDTPPMQYVRQYRIRKAAELLKSTEETIAEIGAQCGFQDASYFTKTFREMKGCTPSEYRHVILKQISE